MFELLKGIRLISKDDLGGLLFMSVSELNILFFKGFVLL